jgi:hypothetical protein
LFGQKLQTKTLRKYICELAMPHRRTEAVYHAIMSCIFYHLTHIFTPFSETPSGDGIVDHLLVPVSGDTGIILEYKICKSKNAKNLRTSMTDKAKETLKKQVLKKHYMSKLKLNPQVKWVYLIVLVFACQNKVVVEYNKMSAA